MEKKTICAISILFIIILIGTHALNLGTVKGYALNISGGILPGSSVSLSVVGCTGTGCTASGTTDANGFYIRSNLNLIPGNTILGTATNGNAFGSASTTATGTGSTGVGTLNITLCAPPQQPALNNVSDTHNNSLITMSWTTYKAGSQYDEFVFDSQTSNTTALSPQTQKNVSYQYHTWQVRTCNTLCCSSYSTDTFNVYNNPPPPPTLTIQGSTTDTTISFSWANYSDPQNEATNNDFDSATDDSFGTTVFTDLNANAPETVSNLTTFTLYYWRVRTCDDKGSCSSYANSSFFVYESICTGNNTIFVNNTVYNNTIIYNNTVIENNTVVNNTIFVNNTITTIIGGRGRTEYVTINNTQICLPNWQCTIWNSCMNGLSTRTCTDANNCASPYPQTFESCSNGISPPPSQSASPQEISQSQVNETPSGPGLITTTRSIFERITIIPWILLAIILLLLGYIYYQNSTYVSREKKVDKSLSDYIRVAQDNGFSDEQIQTKLTNAGFAREEIDFVFKKRKSKNSVPNKQ